MYTGTSVCWIATWAGGVEQPGQDLVERVAETHVTKLHHKVLTVTRSLVPLTSSTDTHSVTQSDLVLHQCYTHVRCLAAMLSILKLQSSAVLLCLHTASYKAGRQETCNMVLQKLTKVTS